MTSQDAHRSDQVVSTSLLLASLFWVGCSWTPEVRPIEPRRIRAGSFVVLKHEPVEDVDYLSVVEDVSQFLGNASVNALRAHLSVAPRSLLDVGTGELCRIPGKPGSVLRAFEDPESLFASHFRQLVHVGEGEDSELQFVDVHCQPQGPSLKTAASPAIYTDSESNLPLAIVLTEQGELWQLNPWLGTRRRIARGVSRWSFVAAPPNDQLSADERGLLLLEAGQLVVRRLSGEEIARFGANVASYSQTNLGGLRVAYERDGAIYEVVKNPLEPARLTPPDMSACQPRYTGARLVYFSPCADRQFTQLDLTNGEVTEFRQGVFYQYEDRGWSIEYLQPSANVPGDPRPPATQWITPPGQAEAVQLEPWLSNIRPLDSTRLSGLDDAKTFGIWTLKNGFVEAAQRVASMQTYIDQLSTANSTEPVFLWIVHHDVQEGVGVLSLLSAANLRLEKVVEGVPVGAFTTFSLFPLVDPALALLRDFTVSGATLDARLIPDLVGATVDTGVFSFAPRAHAREPGLYYSIGPGPREGIWFAPL